MQPASRHVADGRQEPVRRYKSRPQSAERAQHGQGSQASCLGGFFTTRDKPHPQEMRARHFVKSQGEGHDRNVAIGRAERELAASSPIGPEIAAPDMLLLDGTVTIDEAHDESIKSRAVDDQRQILMIARASGQGGMEPQCTLLIAIRITITGKMGWAHVVRGDRSVHCVR